jgi:hypothetical protein
MREGPSLRFFFGLGLAASAVSSSVVEAAFFGFALGMDCLLW